MDTLPEGGVHITENIWPIGKEDAFTVFDPSLPLRNVYSWKVREFIPIAYITWWAVMRLTKTNWKICPDLQKKKGGRSLELASHIVEEFKELFLFNRRNVFFLRSKEREFYWVGRNIGRLGLAPWRPTAFHELAGVKRWVWKLLKRGHDGSYGPIALLFDYYQGGQDVEPLAWGR